ncbi:MAG: beta-lactamase [Flavisolibacter sp.]|nr:beta-lactamase [Flavisolibacter sp.]
MKKLITSVAAIFFSIVVFAQDKSKQIQDLLAIYSKDGKFNGSVLVAQKGTVIYQGGYGFRDAENKVTHEANDIFQIGSITKQITAAVIMQLQEEGKLTVQDKLSKYFPGFANGDKITIENLLTHTSGIYNYTNDEVLMKSDVTKHYSQKEMLDMIKAYKPDFEPGAKWNYSNSAYSILGYIIEKVTGKPYEKVVRERVFTPLGMISSGFDFTHLSAPGKSKGYFSLAGGKPVIAPVVDSTIAYSAGAIYSTVGDLAKWERAVTQGKLLKAESWKAVFTPQKNKYGYGWVIDSSFGKPFTSHSGGIHGFSSYLIRFPQDEVTVIMIDNSSSPHLGKISKNLAAIALGQSYEMPAVRKATDIDTSILKQYVGEYQLSPSFSIVVSLEGKGLRAQATNQPPFDIYAEKENVFFLKVVDAQLEFVKDENGKVTELILHQNGMDQKGKKIK